MSEIISGEELTSENSLSRRVRQIQSRFAISVSDVWIGSVLE